MNGPPHRNLICARCGAAFVCGTGGHDGHCWCLDEPVRIPMPTSPEADCLCPGCLRACADGPKEAAQ